MKVEKIDETLDEKRVIEMRSKAFFLLVLLLFLICLPCYGEALSPSFESIFQQETIEELWALLYTPLVVLYPSLEGFSFVEGSLHHYNGMLYFYTRGAYLYVSLLPIGEDEIHLFVHIKEDEGIEIATILAWDGDFTPVPLKDPIPLNNYLSVEMVLFQEESLGIGIQGTSGAAAGRIGEYTLFSYEQGQGYEKIWSTPTPSVELIYQDPLELVVIEYREWDETFPFYDLSHYCQISYGLFSRKRGTTYYYDKEEHRLIPGEEKEFYDYFSVVNHLLKAIIEEDGERMASFVTEELLERLHEIPLSTLSKPPLSLYPDIHDWAYRVGYEAEGPLINILLSKEEEGGLYLLEEEIEGLLLFAFEETVPPLVKDIHYFRF